MKAGGGNMLASYLDSTNLKPDASMQDIIKLCEQAATYNMAAVCINPVHVPLARTILHQSGVRIATVIAFPLGAASLEHKRFEAQWALANGCDELDMVVNLGAVKDQRYDLIEEEIAAVTGLKREQSFILKMIVETGMLSGQELVRLIGILERQQVDFIKTCTGINSRGVLLSDIEAIKAGRHGSMKIKASGGIKTLDYARQLIAAGVDRLGSSNAAALIHEEMAMQQIGPGDDS